MSQRSVLAGQRKKICARLRQINVLIARQERLLQPQFAHIPSFTPRTNSQYRGYIDRVNAQKLWTIVELECLFVSEFPCNYEFRLGADFRHAFAAPAKIMGNYETMSMRRDLILNTCCLEQNYSETLELIATRPSVEQYCIVDLIKARCLFGTKQFDVCHKFTTRCLKKKISFPSQKIYYLVQRALCDWQRGRLLEAMNDCEVAQGLVNELPERERRQRFAILWFQALINRSLGFTALSVENLQELAAEHKLLPSYAREITPRGLEFLNKYTEALRQKIK